MPVEPPATSWRPRAGARRSSRTISGSSARISSRARCSPGTGCGLFPMRTARPARTADVAPLGWWSPRSAPSFRSTTRPPRTLRRVARPVRDPGRLELRGGDGAAAAIPRGPTAGSTRRSSRRTRRCTGWAGRTPSSAGTTRGSPVVSTAICDRRALRGRVDVPTTTRRCQGRSARPHRRAPRRRPTPATRILDAQWLTPHLELLGARRRSLARSTGGASRSRSDAAAGRLSDEESDAELRRIARDRSRGR